MKTISIFIAEDDNWYAEILEQHLLSNPNHIVKKFENGHDLLAALDENPDIITLDYSLPDINGDEILNRVKKESPNTDVIIVSGQEDISTALNLLNEGAYEYIVKNDETKDRIWKTISNIKENKKLKEEVVQLRAQMGKKYNFSKSIIGTSKELHHVFEIAEKAAKSNILVSISGETGTGKDLIAKAIHYNSERNKEKFVPINIASIPKELIESELFGHEQGSFTGALARKIGKFEDAGNGTIFLDEIGEMDLNSQTKLLRVLQEMEVVRIGGNETIKLNCRIIVATHKTLSEEVEKGNFRQDLYFRLMGLQIRMPSLRKRKSDIMLLSKHFIKAFSKENGMDEKHISEEAREKLMAYSFPGNVRELKAIIELAMVMSDSEIIEAENICYTAEDTLAEFIQNETSLKNYNIQIVKHFLEKYKSNVVKVSEILGIAKSTIYRMMKEGIEPV